MAACISSSKDCEPSLLSLATETLLDIVSYLTAYERLCLRITCKRLHSILSDSRAWHTLVWRDCRRRDSDFKALRLALKLSMSTVQNISISYFSGQRFPFSKFLPQVHRCKSVRYLTLNGMLLSASVLRELLSQLPSLYFLSLSATDTVDLFSIVANVKHLLIFQILPSLNTKLTAVSFFLSLLKSWKAWKYFPPYLQVCNPNCVPSNILSHYVDCLSKSDHPAKLSFYPSCSPAAGNLINKYPLVEIVLHPKVEVVSCVCPSSHESPLLTLCNGRTCLSSEENCEYVSATYNWFKGSSLSRNSLPCLPSTIQSLCLARLACLTSADLSSISECCPNLRCLNIKGCEKALLSLSGLADISEKCLQMTSLNVQWISEVESVATLWEVLASMRKLRHLAISRSLCFPERVEAPKNVKARVSHILPFDEHSLSRVRNSIARMNLFAFEVSYIPFKKTNSYPLQLEIFLPALQWLKHFRISGPAPGLPDVLPFMPHLSCLSVIGTQSPNSLALPTDPNCYCSLKQIYVYMEIGFEELEISEELVQALAHSRSLTHMYLFNVKFSSSCLQFEDFPRLCELCASVRGIPSKQFKLNAHGICGYVANMGVYHDPPVVSSDVQSLWPNI